MNTAIVIVLISVSTHFTVFVSNTTKLGRGESKVFFHKKLFV